MVCVTITVAASPNGAQSSAVIKPILLRASTSDSNSKESLTVTPANQPYDDLALNWNVILTTGYFNSRHLSSGGMSGHRPGDCWLTAGRFSPALHIFCNSGSFFLLEGSERKFVQLEQEHLHTKDAMITL